MSKKSVTNSKGVSMNIYLKIKKVSIFCLVISFLLSTGRLYPQESRKAIVIKDNAKIINNLGTTNAVVDVLKINTTVNVLERSSKPFVIDGNTQYYYKLKDFGWISEDSFLFFEEINNSILDRNNRLYFFDFVGNDPKITSSIDYYDFRYYKRVFYLDKDGNLIDEESVEIKESEYDPDNELHVMVAQEYFVTASNTFIVLEKHYMQGNIDSKAVIYNNEGEAINTLDVDTVFANRESDFIVSIKGSLGQIDTTYFPSKFNVYDSFGNFKEQVSLSTEALPLIITDIFLKKDKILVRCQVDVPNKNTEYTYIYSIDSDEIKHIGFPFFDFPENTNDYLLIENNVKLYLKPDLNSKYINLDKNEITQLFDEKQEIDKSTWIRINYKNIFIGYVESKSIKKINKDDIYSHINDSIIKKEIYYLKKYLVSRNLKRQTYLFNKIARIEKINYGIVLPSYFRQYFIKLDNIWLKAKLLDILFSLKLEKPFILKFLESKYRKLKETNPNQATIIENYIYE